MSARVIHSNDKTRTETAGYFGLLSGTLVRSMDGLLPVEFLAPGDRIICRQGARRLARVSANLHDRISLVRICASTMGHDRPEQDVLVAPDQQILIRDWRARALYGADTAAIPASRLVDGEFIVTEIRTNICLFTLHFAEDEIVYAEGLELACPALTPAFSDA
ncbi:MAG: Hint domain-containing protein [Tabrizicola sp.]|nr:Hint domain-containing protein [Tabrizicola sp.]